MATEKKMPVIGYELWRGASAFTGEPIVVIGTFKPGAGANSKTGPMVQTWIIRQAEAPVHSLRLAYDVDVCGDCKMRPQAYGGKERSCYVHSGMLDTIYSTWKRGRYPKATLTELRHFLVGRELRIGSYGDPLAVPRHLWGLMLQHAEHWTGYTHAWKWLERELSSGDRGGQRILDGWQKILMASVDSEEEQREAKRMGWRTFRTMLPQEEPVGAFDAMIGLSPEALCPASKEGGYRSTCRECQLCDGAHGDNDKRRDVAIYAHGWAAATAPYRRMRASLTVLQAGAR